MNLSLPKSCGRAAERREGGFVVIMILALLAVLAMLLSANASALHHLKGRLLQVEQKQQERWNQERVNGSGTGGEADESGLGR